MKFTLTIAIMALVSHSNGLKLANDALIQKEDIKSTGNEMVDEQNRVKEKKEKDAKWKSDHWNEFEGNYHLDDGTRQTKDGKIVAGVNKY